MRKGDSDKENCKHLVFLSSKLFIVRVLRPSRQFFSYSWGPFLFNQVFEGSILTWQNQFLIEFKPEANVDIHSMLSLHSFLGLHQCWWRMLETICVDDNCKMLVTVLIISVTNVHYLFKLSSDTNIQKMSLTWKFCRQH